MLFLFFWCLSLLLFSGIAAIGSILKWNKNPVCNPLTSKKSQFPHHMNGRRLRYEAVSALYMVWLVCGIRQNDCKHFYLCNATMQQCNSDRYLKIWISMLSNLQNSNGKEQKANIGLNGWDWESERDSKLKAAIHNISCNNFSDLRIGKQCRHFRKMDFSFLPVSPTFFLLLLFIPSHLACTAIKWTCKFIQ